MTRLNIFQRVMRIWEEAHPYNAVQAMRIAGAAEVDRIQATWNHALGACGLGMARVSGRGGRFYYEPAPAQEVTVVDAAQGLEGFITQEMNRPFSAVALRAARDADVATLPFRPFLQVEAGSFYVGVIYQHWVADSVAIRMLLREWFWRLCDPARATGRALQMPRGGFWHYFGPHRCGWHLGEGVASLLESLSDFATARRLEEWGGAQAVTSSIHTLPEGIVEALLAAARRRGGTVNDLFLAALARAVDEHGGAPRRCGRDLALGSIVDLRGSSPIDMGETFGMFLGFTNLVIPAAHLADGDRLVDGIVRKNRQLKECRSAQVSMMRMAAGYAQGRFLSAEKLARFYRDYMPLSGGLSNVNMNRSWAAEYHPSPLVDYLRVAPTGPMVPVVIAITTIGRRFTFVLTRRNAVVDAARGARLAAVFARELTVLAKTG